MTDDDQQLTVVHTHGRSASVAAGGVELARYVYEPYPAPFEAPKPYLHPLRTTAGDIVTAFRPHDHVWHKGLQLTATDVSGVNIWGGHTYVAGQGYVALDNVGSMRPDSVPDVTSDSESATIEQDLTWIDADQRQLAHERRSLRFGMVDAAAGWWVLDLRTTITNARAEPLTFGSPHTRGMTGSGYSGLWWRGPRSFTGGTLLTADGPAAEEDLRGRSSDWVAYVGRHDEADRSSTLVFAHGPGNDVTAAHWFVRSSQFAAVNPSWAFHRTFDIAPDESIERRYRVIVGTGAWSVSQVADAVAALPS